MRDIDFIAEADVTRERIMEILEASFFAAKLDEQGDIFIDEVGVNVWIRVSTELKQIRIFTVYLFAESSTQEQICNFINRASNNSMFRFCSVDNGSFYADFSITFAGGLIATNLAILMRRFSAMVPLIISQQDIENIVK